MGQISMKTHQPPGLNLNRNLHPELAKQDEGTEARFSIRSSVGKIACALHPRAVMVDPPSLFAKLVQNCHRQRRGSSDNHSAAFAAYPSGGGRLARVGSERSLACSFERA